MTKCEKLQRSLRTDKCKIWLHACGRNCFPTYIYKLKKTPTFVPCIFLEERVLLKKIHILYVRVIQKISWRKIIKDKENCRLFEIMFLN